VHLGGELDALRPLLAWLAQLGTSHAVAYPCVPDASLAPLRELLTSDRRPSAFAGDVVWLDGEAAHPWLVADWPDGLRAALSEAGEVAAVAAAWCGRARVLVVVEGGSAVPAELAPGAVEGVRVLWLPYAKPRVGSGWQTLVVGDGAVARCAPFGASVTAPPALAAIAASFTADIARRVTAEPELDLALLAADGWIEREGPGRWRLRRQARDHLLAQLDAPALTRARNAWHAAVLAGWPANAGDTVAVQATPQEAAYVWNDWWVSGRAVDWAQIVNAWNRWARRYGEQVRVRLWHEAMLARLPAVADADVVGARLAIAISRCESDLGRNDSAAAWVARGMDALPDDHPFRVTGYMQASAVAFARNDLTGAIQATATGLAFAERSGAAPIDRAALLSDLAFFRLLAGRPDEAEAPLREAIAAKRQARGRVSIVHDHSVLALLLIALGRPTEAVEVARDAIDQSAREQHADATPYALHALAMALLEAGDVDEAYRVAVDAIAALVPAIHAALEPLLEVTRRRIEIRAGADPATVRAALLAVENAMPAPAAPNAYAGLLLAELLAEGYGDRAAALALLHQLRRHEAEGHVAAMLRTAAARLETAGSDGATVPMCQPSSDDADRVLALSRRFA